MLSTMLKPPTILLSLIPAALAAGSSSNSQFLAQSNPLAGKPAVQLVLEHTPATSPACTKLTGPIETTLCDYETLESVNEELFSRLSELVTTPFFKYFKVDLYRECPFWQENGFCMHRECGVTTIDDESKVPQEWRAAALSKVKGSGAITKAPGCYHRDTDYCLLDDGEEGEFIDLSQNPEGFTGYAGASAHRVWSSIYEENCFGVSEESLSEPPTDTLNQSPAIPLSANLDRRTVETKSIEDETCIEKKVYYKIISGMHASISTHICYLDLNQTTGEWGPNLQCFANRVASHPERLQYIYFNTVLLLRAVSRIGPYLTAYNLENDQSNHTKEVLTDVVKIANSAGQFDESSLFRGEDAKLLKEEFKDHFRNVSRIMDCVGCDKCRLWGKIQVTGLAAAMKILFEMDDKALDPHNLLSRSEVVALFQTLFRFSESLHATEHFRKMWAELEGDDTQEILINSEKAGFQLEKEKAAEIQESQAEKKGSIPNPSNPISPLPTSSPSSPDGESLESSTPSLSEQLVKLRSLGRGVVRVCKRGTEGCWAVVSNAVGAVVRFVTMFFTLSGKERGPGGSEL